MRVGLLLAAAAAGPVWATNTSATPVLMAPVETAQFKPVPTKPVRAESEPASNAVNLNAVNLQGNPLPAVTPTADSVRDAFLRGEAHEQADTATPRAAKPKAAPRSPVQAKATPTPAAAPSPSVKAAKGIEPPVAAAMSSDAFAALMRVLLTSDNGDAPFAIVDKRNAHLWLFDAQGEARGDTTVLLGLARGDDTVPGIGGKPLARIRDGERTTPAGRFVAEPGRNARGDDVFWVDYDAAVSMHRVHEVNRGERRLQRLASTRAADKRISYGCINVPTAFFDQMLSPLFDGQRPVVYLLPETRSLHTIFDTADNLAVSQQRQPASEGPPWRAPTSTVSEFSSRLIMW
ncbi:MAG TPA: hypothetical protein VFU71_20285 [Burkholderiaceae bacterium]|nr:hypothetical protein [Burkholderiaceae bacterium]